MSNWNNKKKYQKKPSPEPVSDGDSLDIVAPAPDAEIEIELESSEGVCPLCNGSKQRLAIGKHSFTNIMKTFFVPCMCYVSGIVSSQYKLLKHLGSQYMHPDKLDPRLLVDFKNLGDNKNFILTGSYDALLIVIKALIMEHRFEIDPPSILFERSIDIVHEYHVPQDDGSSQHLSATNRFDLAVLVFGSNERNQAISPCMAQLVSTRLDEKKPTWVYFPESMPTLTPNSQEYSAELATLLDKYFKRIEVHTDSKVEVTKSQTKRSVTRF